MDYYIFRNSQKFGPYNINAIEQYVNSGSILMQDIAIDVNTSKEYTVREVMKLGGKKTKIVSNGNVISQLKGFGVDLLFPRSAFSLKTFAKDKRLLLISIVGLAPAFLIRFTGSGYITFYAIALYFSLIWGLFFYYVF